MDGLIDEACQLRCCKLCKHSWLPYDQTEGFCKNQNNAYGYLPKMVEELDTCEHWESK